MQPPLTPNWICLRKVFQGRHCFPGGLSNHSVHCYSNKTPFNRGTAASWKSRPERTRH